MLINKYSLILLPISLTTLALYNLVDSTATAHSPGTFQHNHNMRVGYNQQTAHILGAANRAQQAYYFEQAKFAEDAEELGQSGFNLPNNDNYKLTIESKDNSAFIYGIPQQDYGTYKEWSGSRWKDMEEPLYSYVSAIAYFEKNGSFQSTLCVSKTIGEQKLARPEIADGKFVCARDTEELL